MITRLKQNIAWILFIVMCFGLLRPTFASENPYDINSIKNIHGLNYSNNSCTSSPYLYLENDDSSGGAFDYIRSNISNNFSIFTVVSVQNGAPKKTTTLDSCATGGDYYFDSWNEMLEVFPFCIRNISNIDLKFSECSYVYMRAGEKKKLHEINKDPLMGLHPMLKDIEVGVEKVQDVLCLTMPTTLGKMPLVCRDINKKTEEKIEQERRSDQLCNKVADVCYGVNPYSQSILNFSGRTMHCLRESIGKVFFNEYECLPTEYDDPEFFRINSLAIFVGKIKILVQAFLVIHVLLVGLKILMEPDQFNAQIIMQSVIKITIVVYLALGFSDTPNHIGSTGMHLNGTTQLLEKALDMTSAFASIFYAGVEGKGLCSFSDERYEPGFSFYKIWDSIDCRIGSYLGLELIHNLDDSGNILKDTDLDGTENFGGNNSEATELTIPAERKVESLKWAGNFNILTLFIAMIYSGKIMTAICMILFVIILLYTLIPFFATYAMSIITIYAMAYVSPIFVPMLLFEKTYNYFQAWYKIIISCMLQPAIIMMFIVVLMLMYDKEMYGTCEFKRHDYGTQLSTGENIKYSAFEIRLPEEHIEKCKNSPGYKLIQAYRDGSKWKERLFFVFKFFVFKDNAVDFNLVLSLLRLLMFAGVFYFVYDSVNNFAAALTSGPNMSAIANPVQFLKKMYNFDYTGTKPAKKLYKSFS